MTEFMDPAFVGVYVMLVGLLGLVVLALTMLF